MSVINNFMQSYVKEYDFYKELSRICAETLEAKLESHGIRTIVTYRAKKPERLRLKIEARNKTKNYEKMEEIHSDIADFAGVRIALYFPSDTAEVKRIIESDFNVILAKNFPEENKSNPEKRFSGYWANHFRCSLKNDNLNEVDFRYSESSVEIQVASVLMHAWSEVEHDLVYKPLSGEVSEDELAILDQLNGLVMAGEIALERLQRALKIRTSQSNQSFNNHYELATYLYSVFGDRDNDRKFDNLVLGRVDILFSFLKEIKKENADDIKVYLNNYFDVDDERSIVNQIIDYILEENKEYYIIYHNVRKDLSNRNPFREKKSGSKSNETQLIGAFFEKWIELENILKGLQPENKHLVYSHRNSLEYDSNNLNHDKRLYHDFDYLRNIRNRLVHGIEMPSNDSLIETTYAIQHLIDDILKH